MGVKARQTEGGRTKPRRKLNLTRIKSFIVLVVGSVTAVVSGLSGLGAQVAFAPMLTWMLGFSAEKAQATALRYAACAAAAAVAGAFWAQSLGVAPPPSIPGSTRLPVLPPLIWAYGALLFVSATVGAMLARPLTPSGTLFRWKQTFQTIGVGIGLYVLIEVSHRTILNAHIPGLAGWGKVLLIGLGTGALTQFLGLASGVLLVPVLYYLGGYTALQAAAQSLLVVTLASLLPAWTYTRRGLVDPVYGGVTVVGGLLGGFGGGLLLARAPERLVLTLFAVIAMFLSARELARLAFEKPSRPTS